MKILLNVVLAIAVAVVLYLVLRVGVFLLGATPI